MLPTVWTRTVWNRSYEHQFHKTFKLKKIFHKFKAIKFYISYLILVIREYGTLFMFKVKDYNELWYLKG